MNLLLKYLHNGREQPITWLRLSKAALCGIKVLDEKENKRKHLLLKYPRRTPYSST
jgi:hypothetical protein